MQPMVEEHHHGLFAWLPRKINMVVRFLPCLAEMTNAAICSSIVTKVAFQLVQLDKSGPIALDGFAAKVKLISMASMLTSTGG